MEGRGGGEGGRGKGRTNLHVDKLKQRRDPDGNGDNLAKAPGVRNKRVLEVEGEEHELPREAEDPDDGEESAADEGCDGFSQEGEASEESVPPITELLHQGLGAFVLMQFPAEAVSQT